MSLFVTHSYLINMKMTPTVDLSHRSKPQTDVINELGLDSSGVMTSDETYVYTDEKLKMCKRSFVYMVKL